MLYVSGARWAAPFSAALLAACAGNGVGLDANGQPLGSASSAPQGLQLDAAHSYALLVGVPSNEESGLLRVKPGVPDSSYIVLKLEGSAGIVGAQMPFGGPPTGCATRVCLTRGVTRGVA